MNAFREVNSSAAWYATPRRMASPAYEGTYSNADWKSARNGGKNPRVKKKFQWTPYSVTCSA